jgi:hypothetical protein
MIQYSISNVDETSKNILDSLLVLCANWLVQLTQMLQTVSAGDIFCTFSLLLLFEDNPIKSNLVVKNMIFLKFRESALLHFEV